MSELTIKPHAIRWFNTLLKKADKDGHYVEKVTIDPSRAAVILSRNPSNRNIRESKIAQLVGDMMAGRFHFNGETIIISHEGLLNDGQHRLWACLKSGQTFDTLLVVGMDRESRYTIDTGSAKSAGDHLSFQGIPNACTAAAIARYVASWKSERALSRRSSISAQQQIELVKTDERLQEIAGWVDAQKYRLKDLLRGALAGFIFYILAEKAPDEARVFMDQFRMGAGLSAESPIFLAREKLRVHKNLSDIQRIEIMIRAWNHWCKSPFTTLSRLQLMDVVPEISTPIRQHGDLTDTLVIPKKTHKETV